MRWRRPGVNDQDGTASAKTTATPLRAIARFYRRGGLRAVRDGERYAYRTPLRHNDATQTAATPIS
jgi:hypothetical protein